MLQRNVPISSFYSGTSGVAKYAEGRECISTTIEVKNVLKMLPVRVRAGEHDGNQLEFPGLHPGPASTDIKKEGRRTLEA